MKKILVFLVITAMLLSFCILFCSCDNDNSNKEEEQEPDKTIVFLGDSICEGILGASPISERENYCYYGILGQINNFKFINRSVSGLQTLPFYNYLMREDTGATLTNTYIKQADIIHVSILGNDVLQNGTNKFVVEIAKNDFSRLDSILAQTRINFDKIVKRLKEMNPTALIMIQNVYNPIFGNTNMIEEETKQQIEALGLKREDLRGLGDILLDRLNSVATDYLKEYPDSFVLLDVNKKFNEIFESDEEKGISLFYNDHTHPSNYGHAIIADLTQEKLEELGYCDKSKALQNYKELCLNEYDILFSKSDTKKELKEALSSATDCYQVSDVFFSQTKSMEPKYDKDEKKHYVPEDGFYPEDDLVMSISNLSIDAVKVNIMSFLSEARSNIVLSDDGELTLTIKAGLGATSLVSQLLGDVEDMDLSVAIDKYCKPIFPGFTKDDLEYSFDLLEEYLGLSIVGIDYKTDEMKLTQKSISETGHLNEEFKLPSTFGIQLKAKYYLKRVTSESGKEYVGVFVGNHHKNSDPFLIMTLNEQDGVFTSVYFRVEFLQLNFKATVNKEE